MGRLFRDTWTSWNEDNVFRLAAALAYYTCFSLAPLLIIAIAIAGFAFGHAAAQQQVLDQVGKLIGAPGAQAVASLLESAGRPGALATASWVGALALLFGATGAFVSLQDGLNTVWQVKPKPTNLIVGFVRQRLHTFTLVLGIGFLLLISLLISTAISAAGRYLGGRFGPEWIWHAVNSLTSFGVITVLFALLYKLLPDVRIDWADVWLGAAVTAALFTLGKLLIGLYLGHSSFADVYGAAGSPILILAWVYYSSLLLFFGAEFTRAYANRYGGSILPKPNAMPVTGPRAA
jgi:membrane protein